jgi:hypothetical protein
MAIWGCGSPAHCCQPVVAGGVTYAALWSELNTHPAPQVLFTQSSPGHDCHCYKLSPFQVHWGRWHCTHFLRPACLFTVHVESGSSRLSCGIFLPPPLLQAFPLLIAGHVPLLLPSPAGLFIYSSRGKWVFPPLLCSFPPTATFTSFPAPGCWACAAAPAFSSQLVRISPSPSSALRVSRPLCYVSFLLLLLIIQVFFLFFYLGRGWSVQGAMLIWPRIVCGSTTYHLAHLVVRVFPSHLGAVVWQWCRSPLGFSI